MKKEELIFALTESNIDRVVSNEIIDMLERYERIQEELIAVYEEWKNDKRR